MTARKVGHRTTTVTGGPPLLTSLAEGLSYGDTGWPKMLTVEANQLT